LTEKLPIEKNYNEKFLSPWRDADGRYYGLPYVGVIQGVYYNKEIFARLKLPIPQTWEEFLSASEVIKKAGYTPIANGLAKNEENDFFMSLAVNFIGGSKGRELYNVERGRCFNDSNSTRAFQSVLDMMPYMSEDFLQTNSYTSKQRFINQEAAMLFGGSWDVGYFTEFAKFDWDVFAPPALEGSQTYVIFQPDIAIGINKRISPEKQQAALQFLDWLMTKESLSISSKILPGFYPLISLPLDPVDNEHSAQFQKLAADYPIDVRWSYSEISVTNQLPTATNLIQQAQYDMVANGMTPQEATDFLQAGMAQWYAPAQSCTR
jgi:raffinose/stachyose/melibiose transport system substrate-binding protein